MTDHQCPNQFFDYPQLHGRSPNTFSRGEFLPARGLNTFLKTPFLEDARNLSEYTVERIVREAPLCGLENESWAL
ncbi:MAG: hypothetical protein WCA07_04590 [Gloeobacterales cyanobacterium]